MLDFIPVITIYPDMSIHPDKSGRILVYLEYLPTAQSSLIPKVRNEPANKSADKKRTPITAEMYMQRIYMETDMEQT